ncbi:MAG: peroxidase, partial [Bacteroidetes bacterium]|nr:peroxidase [Bacteroidota bacterium]
MKTHLLKNKLFLFFLLAIASTWWCGVVAQIKTAETEIALIDPTLSDIDVIKEGIRSDVKIIYMDGSHSIFEAMSIAIEENAPVKSIHVITHGSNGALFTTTDFFDINSVKHNMSGVSGWKNKFSSDGQISLYGCNIAESESGKQFIRDLSNAAGVSVNASTNLTGSKDLGGDWELEFSTGNKASAATCFNSKIEQYKLTLYKALVWTGAGLQNYGLTVHNYYNSLSGHSSTFLVDNAATMPDLTQYSLVFVNNPDRALNTTEISYLKAHLNKGGRIVFVGEHSGFATQNANVTAAFAALGGHLSIQNLMLDGGATYTLTQINKSSELMDGVSKLAGSAASAINIGGVATVLLKSVSDPTKIIMAQEMLYNGDIVAWADVNEWDVINNASYDTGLFFQNLLLKAGTRITSLTVANLTTTEAYSVSGVSAMSGGNITNDNGSTITERGVCWSTSSASPTTSDNKVLDSNGGTGSFTCKLTGLSLNTTYYARAYAKNAIGTAYGNTISFTTPAISNTSPTAVTDLFTCQKSGTISGNVMSNDFDDDGDAMTATVVTKPSYHSGTFTLNSDGSFTYTNNGTNAPSDFFSYYLSDGKSTSQTVGVSITIFTPSNPPVGADGSITVEETYSFSSSDFTFSDADAGHVFAGIKLVSLPAKGILKYAGLPVSAGSICSDVSKLTFSTNGDSGSSPFATFTFKVQASSGEESASAYTMTINRIGKTPAEITLSDLSYTYDGNSKSASYATTPSGLTVSVTYNGSSTLPINAGTYSVVATINDATYEGSVTGSLVINKANLTVSGAAVSNKVYDGNNIATISGATLVGVVGSDNVVLATA